MALNFNADILGRLGEAATEELQAARAAIRQDAQTFRGQDATADSVAAVQELRSAAEAINAELASRADRSDTQATALADLEAFTAETDDTPAGDDDAAGEDDAPADESLADEGAQADAPAEDPVPAVTASTRPARRPIGTVAPNRSDRRAARKLPQIRSRTTAAAGLRDFAAGAELDRTSLIRAFQAKMADASGGQPGFERYTVATVRTEYPEDRTLRRGAAELANMDLVQAAVDGARSVSALRNSQELVQVRSGPDGANALTAAGLCAPLENVYDIRVVGDVDRPVRDALVRFGADRGGVRYRPAMDGVTQTGGIGVWTVDDDADVTPPTPTKSCVEIVCPVPVDAEIEAIYQCLTFSNMTTRFDPEFYQAVIQSQNIAHARFAENRLLTTLTAASKDVYSTRLLGATRDVLATLDHMVAYYRNVHRLANDVPLRWIAPLWALNLMRCDIVRQMVGDGLQSLAVTDAEITRWLTERNINPTWHLDGIDPADLTTPDPDVVIPAQFYTVLADQSAVPGFPDMISSLLFAEGDWLFLDGGTLDLGVVRDSTLNAANRFQTFSESFEFPAFRGIESIHLAIAVQPTGQSAATVTTASVTD